MIEEDRGGSSKSAFPLVLCCLLISGSPVSRPGQQKQISNSFPVACRDERFRCTVVASGWRRKEL